MPGILMRSSIGGRALSGAPLWDFQPTLGRVAFQSEAEVREPQRRLELELTLSHRASEQLLRAVDPIRDRVLVDAQPSRSAEEARVLLEEHRKRRAQPHRGLVLVGEAPE